MSAIKEYYHDDLEKAMRGNARFIQKRASRVRFYRRVSYPSYRLHLERNRKLTPFSH